MNRHSKCGGPVWSSQLSISFIVAPRLLILDLFYDIAINKKVFHFNRLGHFQLVFGSR